MVEILLIYAINVQADRSICFLQGPSQLNIYETLSGNSISRLPNLFLDGPSQLNIYAAPHLSHQPRQCKILFTSAISVQADCPIYFYGLSQLKIYEAPHIYAVPYLLHWLRRKTEST